MPMPLDRPARAALVIAGALLSAPASAVYTVDSLILATPTAPFFVDDFSDGAPPPSAPNFASGAAGTYATNGTITESGGKAILDPDNGFLGQAFGSTFRTIIAKLQSNINPASNSGLKQATAWSVSALFDLAPIGTSNAFTGYGLRMTDAGLGNVGGFGDLLVFNIAGGSELGGVTRVGLGSQNLLANTQTTIATYNLTPADLLNSQILLTLDHAAGSNLLTASFTLGGVKTTLGSAALFSNENFTSAAIYAFDKQVPEPGSLVLAMSAIASLGMFARRRRRD
jgi:hypothetical protein